VPIDSWQLTDDVLFARTIAVPFAWGDASPLNLGTVPADKIVESVSILVTEAFDGTGASLTVGDASDPDGLLIAAENDPTQLGGYESHPGISYGTDTVVQLTINPGSSPSQGQGLVTIRYNIINS